MTPDKIPDKIIDTSIIGCLLCEHDKEHHITDNHGFNYCEKCECHYFVDNENLHKSLASKIRNIYK